MQSKPLLENLYSFDAVSYYWGTVEDLEHVIVHGSDSGAPIPSCEVPITRNLTSALREFRRRATIAGEPLEMWTDALCINQRDAIERDFQVYAMWIIFQASRRIRVWLGDRSCSAAAENGLAGLVTFSEHFNKNAFNGKELLDENARSVLDRPDEASKLLDSIGALMDLPYWHRGRTLQEPSAPRPVFFHFDDLSCELLFWAPFYSTLDRIWQFARERSMRVGTFTSNPKNVLYPFLQVLISQRREQKISRDMDLVGESLSEWFLYSALRGKTWHTTDPRDCVFILRGFHKMFDQLKTGYDNTVEEIYSDATAIQLRSGGTWSRGWWGLPFESPDLPSWVIDFSAAGDHATAKPREVEEVLLRKGRFNASAHSSIRIQITAPQTLETAAFVYDEIKTISRCLTSRERKTESFNMLWTEWSILGLVQAVQDPIAMFRTVCAGLALHFKPFASEDVSLFWRHPTDKSHNVPRRPDHPARTQKDDSMTWESWVRWLTLQKRFFVSKNGRMGLAPNSAAVGDRIAIFASGDMPFVVRRVDTDVKREAHILVGSCYLDRVMHGEAVYKRAKRAFDELQEELPSLNRRKWLETTLSLELGDTAHKPDFTELSWHKQSHGLKRTRSLDSGRSYHAVNIGLAFRDNLCLV